MCRGDFQRPLDFVRQVRQLFVFLSQVHHVRMELHDGPLSRSASQRLPAHTLWVDSHPPVTSAAHNAAFIKTKFTQKFTRQVGSLARSFAGPARMAVPYIQVTSPPAGAVHRL